MTKEKKPFLSVAGMDAWAAEQNEIAYHNEGIYLRELIDYATERGSDWRAPGRLEQVRRHRDQDAHSALSRRINHGGGKPPRYDKPAIRAALLTRHAAHRDEDWKITTRLVAAGVEPTDGDAPHDVLRAVRRYCHDLRWPSKRKGHVAAT
jgi:hypothetical protein